MIYIEKELKTIPYYINDIVYPELKLNDKLVSMLDKKQFGRKFTIHRANNHIRQYYTLHNSWSIIKKLNPDILIRIRDDATLTSPLKLIELSKVTSHPIKCITPIKNSHGGINDRFAIVSKNAIETYLKKPLEVYNSINNFKYHINNPEQFINMFMILTCCHCMFLISQ